MPGYKPSDCHALMLPVVLSEQIVQGSFAFALNYLVDHELDLSALDALFKNDEVGASAYDPRVMLKIVLLAYSQGLISSRSIAAACARNVQFIAISGNSQPSHAHIAKFVVSLSDQIKPLFAQVLMTCDAQGLIGREMFAIDGVKLPSNASKERSGTHEELSHRAERLDKAADKILTLHQAQDKAGTQEALDAKRQAPIDALHQEAARTRAFVSQSPKRLNNKGQELKSNITDPDSAKMATNKGVIQGYAAQAAVDSAHQVIIAADVVGSGSEQAMLTPMIEQAKPWSDSDTLVTADAGYHSDANVQQLHDSNTPALIADGQMRKRDERFEGRDKHKARPEAAIQRGCQRRAGPTSHSLLLQARGPQPPQRTHAPGHRLIARSAVVQPAHRYRGAGVCEPAAQQADASSEPPRASQGQDAVEPVLHGAQHREAAENGLRANRGSVRRATAAQSLRSRNLRRTESRSPMNPETRLCKASVALRGESGCGFEVFGQPR
jgi:transposase/Skp family chaperone for outer membrane proteins